MTYEEIAKCLEDIIDILHLQNRILKFLLDDSIAREEYERSRTGHSIFDDLDEEAREFMKGVLHD